MAVITRRRFTADDYYRMGEAGILSARDRVGLIDGEVVTMSPIGSAHSSSVARANRALVTAVGEDAIVRPQLPVRLSTYDEPQPDLALLKPRSDFYRTRHPEPDDVLLIIEISDSSLVYDRTVKGPLYAARGIQEYWIADLEGAVLLRFTEPGSEGYRRVEEYRSGESIAPRLLLSCIIDAGVLL